MFALIVLCLLVAAPSAQAAGPERVVHVAPTGSDAGRGTRDAPLLTIGRALELMPRGGRIALAAGNYPPLLEVSRRLRWVTIRGPRTGPPASIHGAMVAGANKLRFEHLRFTDRFYVSVHPTRGASQPSHDIVLRWSELTNAKTQPCVTVRAGAHNVSILANHIHDCRYGVTGPGDGITDPRLRTRSHHITIAGNLMERFRGDGIQIAHWSDVRIVGNRITDMADPVEHNDGIQVMGNVSRLVVRGNVIARSGMLFYAQDELGPNDDLTVAGNLMTGAGGYGIQVLGTYGLQLLGNTVWNTRYGAVLFRGGNRGAATDTVVVDNVLDGYGQSRGARAAVLSRNVIGRMRVSLPDNFANADPHFTDAVTGDFRLAPSSPVGAAGSAGGALGAELTLTSVPALPVGRSARAASRAQRATRP